MYDLLIMIAVCTVFAAIIQGRAKVYASPHICIKKDIPAKIFYFVIFAWIILFAGLRTNYNDTITYIDDFVYFVSDQPRFSLLSEPYGGFELYMSLIKRFFNANPQWFIFISALICIGLTIPFITRHTDNYMGTIFLFLIGNYLFMMAGIKQAMSIAIALWAIEFYLSKKYIRAVILMLLAISIHPYVICMVSIVVLKGKVWDFKTVVMALCFAIAFINLESLFSLISLIGQDYSGENFNEYTINPFRVLLEFVPIAISFIYRDRIRKENDVYLNLGINMRIISFTFIFLGLFFSPVYLGRMSIYFSALSSIAIPKMLKVSFSNDSREKYFTQVYYIIFAVYFLLDLTRLGYYNLSFDRFKHTDIMTLFN